jgi:hypothetical protein
MCQNANKTAASLMAAIRPTIVSLLTIAKLADTPNGIAAMQAYDAALVAVQNWKQGSSASIVLQLISAFQGVFNVLPVPDTYKMLANVILAGVEAVIGVLTANSPAPAAPAGAMAMEEPQAMHQAAVASDTVQKVHALVPGIKLSRFHSAESQYAHAWNKQVDAGKLDASLKVAA